MYINAPFREKKKKANVNINKINRKVIHLIKVVSLSARPVVE